MKSDLQINSTQVANGLRIAIVYDRVNTRFGGAEQVLLALHELFPQAPLYTSVYDPKIARWSKAFPTVVASFLNNLPFANRFHRWLLPFMTLAFESFDFSEYDIVISISSAESKSIITNPETLHICYLLTPPRYLWSHTFQYQTGIFKWIKGWQFSCLRQADYVYGQRPDFLIPISHQVRRRAEKYYRRSTEKVIYPPVNLPKDDLSSKLSLKKSEDDYFLVVSRLVEYKNVELAIKACACLKQRLVIVGDGPEKSQLNKLIKTLDCANFIKICSNVPAYQLRNLYNQARGLLLLAEEDFGIVALEAQSHGLPVIINGKSGGAETVLDQVTGFHLEDLQLSTIEAAITRLKDHHWKRTVIKNHVAMYNKSQFQQRFLSTIQSLWQKHLKQKGAL